MLLAERHQLPVTCFTKATLSASDSLRWVVGKTHEVKQHRPPQTPVVDGDVDVPRRNVRRPDRPLTATSPLNAIGCAESAARTSISSTWHSQMSFSRISARGPAPGAKPCNNLGLLGQGQIEVVRRGIQALSRFASLVAGQGFHHPEAGIDALAPFSAANRPLATSSRVCLNVCGVTWLRPRYQRADSVWPVQAGPPVPVCAAPRAAVGRPACPAGSGARSPWSGKTACAGICVTSPRRRAASAP